MTAVDSETTQTDDLPLWAPSDSRALQSHAYAFAEQVEADWNVTIRTFAELYRFSVAEPEKFWVSVRDYAGLIAETWGITVIADRDRMPGARFFPDARLNIAENLLRRTDDADAIVFRGEDKVRRRLSFRALYDLVSRIASALKQAGVQPGDRVAGFVANLPESVACTLAAHSLGAVWSSCSPDFGVQGVLDRFGQIEPRILFAVDGYYYNGKAIDCLERLAAVQKGLPTLERTVVIPYLSPAPSTACLADALTLDGFIAGHRAGPIRFERLPFNHPAYILYSSGTTGVPKCIVHGAGGVLIEHIKEHLFHCDIRYGDRLFYFTTCGWMMWNWQVSALATGATLLLYDGSPFYPDGNVLFDYADAEGMTLFGTAAKYIDAVSKAGLRPMASHRLDTVRTLTSTGSPLSPESFDFVYGAIKRDIHLASISGGTDIVGCFVLGDPTGPVWRGEIQTRSLGLAVEVFDENGKPVIGEKGELVCTAPFPSMPICFWNDPEGEKYHAAYFDRFPGVWCHGDYVELNARGGMVIYGRSDATLNPGGVRIGTAEIYRQVEQIEEILESMAVGQDWDNDVRVVLFVVLRPGVVLDDGLKARIKDRLRKNCSPRHVPSRIVQVADIPRTKSGKISELAVRDIIHGRAVKNREALANPAALDLFRALPELQA